MTDYKQLCAELVDDLELCDWPYKIKETIRSDIDRARAALVEPEPQRRCIYSPVQSAECGGPCEQGPEHCDCGELWVTEPAPEPRGPTQRQLMMLANDMGMASVGDAVEYARAVLARWGNHPESPDSSTQQPVPVSERLPLPGDCDEKGRCWWWYPEVPGKTYGYWAHEDDAVPERALNEQPTHWLSVHALPSPLSPIN